MSKVNAFPTFVVAIVWAVVYGRKLGVVRALLLFGTPCVFALVVYLWFGFDHAVALLDTVLHDSIMPLPTTPMGLWAFTRILFASFWGRLGWMNVPLAPAFIIVFSVLSAINWLKGLISSLSKLFRSIKSRSATLSRGVCLASYSNCSLCTSSRCHYNNHRDDFCFPQSCPYGCRCRGLSCRRRNSCAAGLVG